MTDYRDRRIKAILVPSDERIEIGELQEKSIREWLEIANIKFLAIVNASSDFNMSMIIDDDGHDRRLPWNPRAHFLCGYPTDHPIVGDAIMVSLDWVDDDGKDVVDLKEEGQAYLADKGKRGEEFAAWLAQPEGRWYFHEHRRRFPQPPVEYPKG
jgi:PAS domain-containing protein